MSRLVPKKFLRGVALLIFVLGIAYLVIPYGTPTIGEIDFIRNFNQEEPIVLTPEQKDELRELLNGCRLWRSFDLFKPSMGGRDLVVLSSTAPDRQHVQVLCSADGPVCFIIGGRPFLSYTSRSLHSRIEAILQFDGA